MPMCPYFHGDQKTSKSFQIKCGPGAILSFTEEQKFLDQLKACSGGDEMDECRPFLFRRLEEMGEKPTSEHSTEQLRERYLEKIQEEKKTMNDMVVHEGDMSPQYKQAVEVTRRIKMNGSIAAEAVYQVCKDLKLMRDQKLYIELGFDSFDEYSEAAVGIKARQAYNYISTYERLGDSFLQSNANLGITKLSLLADAPPTERASLADQDLAGKSTREVEELVKKLKDAGEQLSMLTEERNRLKDDKEELEAQTAKAEASDQEVEAFRARNEELYAKLRGLEAELHKAQEAAKGAAVDDKAIEKIKETAAESARKEAEERIRRELDKKHADDLAEAKKQARAAGEKAGEKSVKDQLEALEKEKAAALERAAEYEKKLSVAGSNETVIILHLSEELQTVFGKLVDTIAKARESDAETAEKFKGATGRMLDMLRARLEQA